MKENISRIIIGSEEWCALPGLGIPAIKARVDSGARASSIHALNICAFRRGKDDWVSFEIPPLQQDDHTVLQCERPVIELRPVKSSNGLSETRYVVRTTLQLGEANWDIELTLANRATMAYRMLLGREAMRDRVLIDPSQSFCLGDIGDDQIAEKYSHRRDA